MTHTMDVLGGDGHLTLTWDPAKPEEVAEARKMVEKLRKEGYTFFVVAGSPGSDEVEQGNGMIIVRRIEDPTDEKEMPELAEALPPEPGEVIHLPDPPKKKCQGKTQGGRPCKRTATKGTDYCPWHPEGKTRTPKGGKPKRSSQGQADQADQPTGRRHVAVRRMSGG